MGTYSSLMVLLLWGNKKKVEFAPIYRFLNTGAVRGERQEFMQSKVRPLFLCFDSSDLSL